MELSCKCVTAFSLRVFCKTNTNTSSIFLKEVAFRVPVIAKTALYLIDSSLCECQIIGRMIIDNKTIEQMRPYGRFTNTT